MFFRVRVPLFRVRVPAWFYRGAWFQYQLIEADVGLYSGAAHRGGVVTRGVRSGLWFAPRTVVTRCSPPSGRASRAANTTQPTVAEHPVATGIARPRSAPTSRPRLAAVRLVRGRQPSRLSRGRRRSRTGWPRLSRQFGRTDVSRRQREKAGEALRRRGAAPGREYQLRWGGLDARRRGGRSPPVREGIRQGLVG